LAAVRYNLRLSDGAELVVDYRDLSTWLVDDGALVQRVGSNEWHPLKAFLAPSDPLDPSPSEPEEPRPIRPQPTLMVLADDLGGSGARSTVQTFAPGDDLPSIRLKPRDDAPAAPEAAGSPAIAANLPGLVEPAPWQDPRDEKLFAAIAAFGGFLSVWLYRLDRQLKRWSWLRP
jgi:hypothetical protein